MSPEDNTSELMTRAVAGDRTAYAKIVRRYSDPIRRVAYLMLHSSVAAEDVTQETFTRALAKVKDFRGDGNPHSWFYSIALNLCRRKLRDEKRHAASADGQSLEGGKKIRFKPRGVLTSLIRRETRMKLTIALGYLTDGQREAFVLHYVEELPYDEIGRILDIKPGAARALSHRARQVLQEKLPDLAF